MKKSLRVLILVTLIWLAAGMAMVAGAAITDLEDSCSLSGCQEVKDISLGDCRVMEYSSDYGSVKSMACVKGDYVEMYKQEFPFADGELKLSGLSVDKWKGYDKKLLSEIGVDDSVVTEEKITSVEGEEMCGDKSCSDVIEEWNDATWEDIVDDDFATNDNLAAVRWYNTEGTCTGDKCEGELHNGHLGRELNVAEDRFVGVTDEFSNVLLNFAMGEDKERYDELHKFSLTLKHPQINDLQCWKYYIDGKGSYENYEDVCAADDSASDASIRILGAYGLACAKQQAGMWEGENYCEDYVNQGESIFGLNGGHGPIKILDNGKYFLANGYNNQESAPTADQSIRPDYYELQFLMDFAEYVDDVELKKGVMDIYESYMASLGDNGVHKGKTGKFASDGVSDYQCTDLCGPEYLDNIDSWRAIPALSNFYVFYNDVMDESQKAVFERWWNEYGGGSFSATGSKPFEIFSNSGDGKVKSSEDSYKTLSMWIPLAVGYDKNYAEESVEHLISKYDWNERQFVGAAYYGGYFSQFAQRAVGVYSGRLSPSYWKKGVVVQDVEKISLVGNEGYVKVNEESVEGNQSDGEVEILNLGNLPANAEENGVDCIVKEDRAENTCRTVRFGCSSGDIVAKVCEKGENYYEVYKQEYSVSGQGEACFLENDGCVGKWSGYDSFELTQENSQNIIVEEEKTELDWTQYALSCSSPGGCQVTGDWMEGQCRLGKFVASGQEGVIKACLKENNKVEVYRHQTPSVNFEACIGDICLDQWTGYGVFYI